MFLKDALFFNGCVADFLNVISKSYNSYFNGINSGDKFRIYTHLGNFYIEAL